MVTLSKSRTALRTWTWVVPTRSAGGFAEEALSGEHAVRVFVHHPLGGIAHRRLAFSMDRQHILFDRQVDGTG